MNLLLLDAVVSTTSATKMGINWEGHGAASTIECDQHDRRKKSKGRRHPVSEPVLLSQPVFGLNELAAMWPTGKKGLCRQAEIPLRTFNAWLKLTGPITSEQLECRGQVFSDIPIGEVRSS